MRLLAIVCSVMMLFGPSPEFDKIKNDRGEYWSYPKALAIYGAKGPAARPSDFHYKSVVNASLEEVAHFYLEKLGIKPDDKLHQQLTDDLELEAQLGFEFGTHAGDHCITVQGLQDHLLLTKYNLRGRGAVSVSLGVKEEKTVVNVFEVLEIK